MRTSKRTGKNKYPTLKQAEFFKLTRQIRKEHKKSTLLTKYRYSTVVSGAPNAGYFRGNVLPLASSTVVALNEVSDIGENLSSVFSKMGAGSAIYIAEETDNSNAVRFTATGIGTDLGDYWTFPVEIGEASGAFSNNAVCSVFLSFELSADASIGTFGGPTLLPNVPTPFFDIIPSGSGASLPPNGSLVLAGLPMLMARAGAAVFVQTPTFLPNLTVFGECLVNGQIQISIKSSGPPAVSMAGMLFKVVCFNTQ